MQENDGRSFALDLLNSGYGVPVVERRLVEHGLTQEAATALVDSLLEQRIKAQNSAALWRNRGNLIGDVLLCVLGPILCLGYAVFIDELRLKSFLAACLASLLLGTTLIVRGYYGSRWP
jgi:hypothetical protein